MQVVSELEKRRRFLRQLAEANRKAEEEYIYGVPDSNNNVTSPPIPAPAPTPQDTIPARRTKTMPVISDNIGIARSDMNRYIPEDTGNDIVMQEDPIYKPQPFTLVGNEAYGGKSFERQLAEGILAKAPKQKIDKYHSSQNASPIDANMRTMDDVQSEWAARAIAPVRDLTQSVPDVMKFASQIPNFGRYIANKYHEFGQNRLGGEDQVYDYTNMDDNALWQASESMGQWLDKAFPVEPIHRLKDPATQVTGALGQMIGQALLGKTARLAKVPSVLAVAGLGSMQVSAQEMKQAWDKTKDPNKTLTTGLINIAIGATEALPVERFLGRLDDASGGVIGKSLRKKLSETFAQGIEGGLWEGIQEYTQQAASNLTAKEIYDAGRDIFESAPEGGAVGFAVGFIMNALGAQLRMRKISRLEYDNIMAEIDANVNRIGAGQSLKATEGIRGSQKNIGLNEEQRKAANIKQQYPEMARKKFEIVPQETVRQKPANDVIPIGAGDLTVNRQELYDLLRQSNGEAEAVALTTRLTENQAKYVLTAGREGDPVTQQIVDNILKMKPAQEKQAEITELAAQGKGVKQIAKETGIELTKENLSAIKKITQKSQKQPATTTKQVKPIVTMPPVIPMPQPQQKPTDQPIVETKAEPEVQSLPPVVKQNIVPGKPTATKAEAKQAEGFISYPVESLETELDEFQPRKEDFAKQTYDRIVSEVEEGVFEKSALPANIVWENEKGNIVTLAGHSRAKAFNDLAKGKVIDSETGKLRDAKIPDKYKGDYFTHINAQIFSGTRAKAREVAQKSNLAAVQTDVENAIYFRELRKKFSTKKETNEKAKQLYGANAQRIIDYSYLDPDGKTWGVYKQTDKMPEGEDKDTIRNVAQYVGKARRVFPGLTADHETEMFNWLFHENGFNEHTLTSFIDKVTRILGRPGYDANKPLNLAMRGTKGFAQRTLEADIAEAIKIRDELKAERAGEGEFKGTSITESRLKELDEMIDRYSKDIINLRSKMAEAKKADKSQLDIFDNLDEAIEQGDISDERAVETIGSVESVEDVRELEKLAEDIERKAESENEAELNEAVQEADKLINAIPVSKSPFPDEELNINSTEKQIFDFFNGLKDKIVSIGSGVYKREGKIIDVDNLDGDEINNSGIFVYFLENGEKVSEKIKVNFSDSKMFRVVEEKPASEDKEREKSDTEADRAKLREQIEEDKKTESTTDLLGRDVEEPGTDLFGSEIREQKRKSPEQLTPEEKREQRQKQLADLKEESRQHDNVLNYLREQIKNKPEADRAKLREQIEETKKSQQKIKDEIQSLEGKTGGGELFGNKSDDIKPIFQILGKKGAEALDKAEEATTRLDNLKVAREMEQGVPYVYHGTSRGALSRIINEGLKVGVNREGAGINFTNNETYAKSYADRKGGSNPVMLRSVKKESYKIDNSVVNKKNNQDYITFENVPLSDLEIKVGKDWTALSNYDFYENKIIDASLVSSDKKRFTPQQIKLATGWERGADGKWRYEVPDGKINDEHYSKLLDRKFSDDIKSGFINATTLGELYEDENLYNAYPQLESMQVIFYEDSNNTASASYSSTENAIYIYNPLSLNTIENRNSILVHEIQHAIQEIEGFAKGGNTFTGGLSPKEIFLSKTQKERIAEIDRLVDVLKNSDLPDKDFNEFAKQRSELYGEKSSIYSSVNKSPEEAQYEYYRRLAGEVESRNVQTRMNMTPEERLNTLLSETEDVSREDQIIIMESLDNSLTQEQPKTKNTAWKDLSKAEKEAELKLVDDLLGEGFKVVEDSTIKEPTGEPVKALIQGNTIKVNPDFADLTSIPHEIAHGALKLPQIKRKAKALLRKNGWDGRGDILDFNNETLVQAHENLAEKYEDWFNDYARFAEKEGSRWGIIYDDVFTFLRNLWEKISNYFKGHGIASESEFFRDLSKGKFRQNEQNKSQNMAVSLAQNAVEIEKHIQFQRKPKSNDLALIQPGNSQDAGKDLNDKSFKDVIRLKDISQKLLGSLGIKGGAGFRPGSKNIKRFSRKASGLYFPDSGIIRAYNINEIPTIAHEFAHKLDAEIFNDVSDNLKLKGKDEGAVIRAAGIKDLKRKDKVLNSLRTKYGNDFVDNVLFKRALREESRNISGYAKSKAKQNDWSEPYAEFFREYLTNNESIRQKAPEFTKWFESMLKQNPELKAVVNEVLDMVKKAKAQDERYMVESAIHRVQTSWLDGIKAIADNPAEFLEKIKFELVDATAPFEALSNALKDAGKYSGNAKDAYVRVLSLLGVDGKVKQFLENSPFQEVNGKLKVEDNIPGLFHIIKRGVTTRQFKQHDGMLAAQRTIELAKRGMQGLGLIGGKDTAEKAIVKYRRQFGDEYVNNFLEEINKYNDAVLRYYRDSGMLSKEQYDQIKELNPFYVPMQRYFEEYEKQGGNYTAGKYLKDYTANVVKTIEGSSRETLSPIETMIKNTYDMIASADRNRTLSTLVKNLRELDKSYVQEIPAKIWKKALVLQPSMEVDPITGMISLGESKIKEAIQLAMEKPVQGNIITVVENGERHYYDIPKDFYDSFFWTTGTVSKLISALSLPTRILRAGAVGINPSFGFGNIFKDQGSAFMYSKHGYVPFYHFAKGIVSAVKRDESYQKFLASGADMSFLTAMDKMLSKSHLAERTGKRYNTRLTKYLKNPIQLLYDFNRATEIGTRAGEYSNVYKMTGDPWDAMKAARQISGDYGVSGKSIREVSSLIAFLNARAQHMKLITQVAEGKRVPYKKMWYMTMLGYVVPSMLIYLLNHEDDEIGEIYDDLPNWRKIGFWNIHIPGTNRFFPVPKGFFGIMYGTSTEYLMDYLNKKENVKPVNMGIGLFNEYSPITDIGSVMPQFLKIPAEQLINKNFFTGREIVSQQMQNLEAIEQYDDRTPEIIKKLCSETGLSPKRVESLIAGIFAGAGKTGVNMADLMLQEAGVLNKSESYKWNTISKLPIFERFYKMPEIGTKGKQVQKFYEIIGEYEDIYDRINNYIAKGNDGKATELIEKQKTDLDFRWYLDNKKMLDAFKNIVYVVNNGKDEFMLNMDEKSYINIQKLVSKTARNIFILHSKKESLMDAKKFPVDDALADIYLRNRIKEYDININRKNYRGGISIGVK